jgi:DNA-binding NtrC family response regulator
MSVPNDSASARLLMVEDDEDFRQIVLRRLARRGLDVVGVGDSRAALEACLSREFDVVLLDGSLPGVDGPTLLAELRRTRPALPVIFLSGHGDPESVRTARERGACEYLVKPCGLSQIEAAIERALRSAEGS